MFWAVDDGGAPAPGGSPIQLPGHIRKAFRSLEKYLPAVDIIVELVDARMPGGSRPGKLVERLGKDSVIVLGKADLADPAATQAWEREFARLHLPCVPFAMNDRNGIRRLLTLLREMPLTRRGATGRKFRRIMVIGIPNVGKSTLINVLAGRHAARTANKPGVTKSIQWIKLPGELELLDLPGILDFALLRRGDVLRLINTIPGPEEDPERQAGVLLGALLQAGVTHQVPGLAAGVERPAEFLETYARDKNFLGKGGSPDLLRGARDFIKRFQQGGFGRITLEKVHAEALVEECL